MAGVRAKQQQAAATVFTSLFLKKKDETKTAVSLEEMNICGIKGNAVETSGHLEVSFPYFALRVGLGCAAIFCWESTLQKFQFLHFVPAPHYGTDIICMAFSHDIKSSGGKPGNKYASGSRLLAISYSTKPFVKFWNISKADWEDREETQLKYPVLDMAFLEVRHSLLLFFIDKCTDFYLYHYDGPGTKKLEKKETLVQCMDFVPGKKFNLVIAGEKFLSNVRVFSNSSNSWNLEFNQFLVTQEFQETIQKVRILPSSDSVEYVYALTSSKKLILFVDSTMEAWVDLSPEDEYFDLLFTENNEKVMVLSRKHGIYIFNLFSLEIEQILSVGTHEGHCQLVGKFDSSGCNSNFDSLARLPGRYTEIIAGKNLPNLSNDLSSTTMVLFCGDGSVRFGSLASRSLVRLPLGRMKDIQGTFVSNDQTTCVTYNRSGDVQTLLFERGDFSPSWNLFEYFSTGLGLELMREICLSNGQHFWLAAASSGNFLVIKPNLRQIIQLDCGIDLTDNAMKLMDTYVVSNSKMYEYFPKDSVLFVTSSGLDSHVYLFVLKFSKKSPPTIELLQTIRNHQSNSKVTHLQFIHRHLNTADNFESNVRVTRRSTKRTILPLQLISTSTDKNVNIEQLFASPNDGVSFQIVSSLKIDSTIRGGDCDFNHMYTALFGDDGHISIIDNQTHSKEKTYKCPKGGHITNLKIDPSGSYIAVSSLATGILLLDFYSGEVVADSINATTIFELASLHWSANGLGLICPTRQGMVFFYELLTDNISSKIRKTLEEVGPSQLTTQAECLKPISNCPSNLKLNIGSSLKLPLIKSSCSAQSILSFSHPNLESWMKLDSSYKRTQNSFRIHGSDIELNFNAKTCAISYKDWWPLPETPLLLASGNHDDHTYNGSFSEQHPSIHDYSSANLNDSNIENQLPPNNILNYTQHFGQDLSTEKSGNNQTPFKAKKPSKFQQMQKTKSPLASQKSASSVASPTNTPCRKSIFRQPNYSSAMKSKPLHQDLDHELRRADEIMKTLLTKRKNSQPKDQKEISKFLTRLHSQISQLMLDDQPKN